jgi:hypothetical protein
MKIEKAQSIMWKVTKYFTIPAFLLVIVASIFGSSETKTIETKFEGNFVKWIPTSPATGEIYYTIKNIGKDNGVAECKIKMSDDAYHYHGFDLATSKELEPNESIYYHSTLTITNEGSLWVTQGSVECEGK